MSICFIDIAWLETDNFFESVQLSEGVPWLGALAQAKVHLEEKAREKEKNPNRMKAQD